MSKTNANVLLITATDLEARAVLDAVNTQFGRSLERRYIGNKTYYDLGTIGDASIFMVQSEMGSSGPSGATLTVMESIQALQPAAIIMVGIAFGVDSQKQQIGDILVAKQLLGYELQRLGIDANGLPTICVRGDRPAATPWLLDRFRSGEKDWQGAPVQFGLVLSGEKLIDQRDFRDRLLSLEPEAIGGEMEGSGLYAAAYLQKVDWILVKAICDWADGNKSHNKKQRQGLAARNAVAFTLHVLKQGGLVPLGDAGHQPDGAGSAPARGGVVITNNAPNQGAQGTFNAPVTFSSPLISHEPARERNER